MFAPLRRPELYAIQGGLNAPCDFTRYGLLRYLDDRGLSSFLLDLDTSSLERPEIEWEVLTLFVRNHIKAEDMMEDPDMTGAKPKNGGVEVTLSTRSTQLRKKFSAEEAKRLALGILRAAVLAERAS